jgi:hypothetical protein
MSLDTSIYRISEEGDMEGFSFDKYFYAMHRDLATGVVYALGNNGHVTPHTVYTVNNPGSGTMTLTQFSQLSQHYGSFTQIGDMFYGIHSDELWEIDLSDPGHPSETLIGGTGVGDDGGSAYDADNNVLYMMSDDTDSLYSLDPDTGLASFVGHLGISVGSCGAEWLDGMLYTGLENHSSGTYEIGTVDMDTGLYSNLLTLGSYDAITGMTVIPEPGTLGLLVAGGLVIARRRR